MYSYCMKCETDSCLLRPEHSQYHLKYQSCARCIRKKHSSGLCKFPNKKRHQDEWNFPDGGSTSRSPSPDWGTLGLLDGGRPLRRYMHESALKKLAVGKFCRNCGSEASECRNKSNHSANKMWIPDPAVHGTMGDGGDTHSHDRADSGSPYAKRRRVVGQSNYGTTPEGGEAPANPIQQKTCPNCGIIFARRSVYDTHVCNTPYSTINSLIYSHGMGGGAMGGGAHSICRTFCQICRRQTEDCSANTEHQLTAWINITCSICSTDYPGAYSNGPRRKRSGISLGCKDSDNQIHRAIWRHTGVRTGVRTQVRLHDPIVSPVIKQEPGTVQQITTNNDQLFSFAQGPTLAATEPKLMDTLRRLQIAKASKKSRLYCSEEDVLKEPVNVALQSWLAPTDGMPIGTITPAYKADIEALIERKTIPANDLREGLRGQQGVYARMTIRRHTVLGIYVGCLHHADSLPERDELAAPNAYLFNLIGTCNDVPYKLTIDGEVNSNWTALVNAATTYQQGTTPYPQNCGFVKVHYQGCPYIVLVAEEDIPEGSELLTDYGQAYWDEHRQQIKKQLSYGTAENPIEI